MNISKRCYFTIIFINSVLLAGGISMVAVSIAQYGNKWPLLTIFVHLLAIVFPTACACGQCQYDDADYALLSDDYGSKPLMHVPWVIFGMLVVIGYAVPVELFRAHKLDEKAVYLTVAGGTTILASVLIYVKVIYFQKNDW